MATIQKVLIANRGEIAVRVIKTCRKMGISTVAVYSEIESEALHVRLADESVCLGPAASRESYLRSDKILQVCKELGVDAVHPGYGFLSENAEFARACQEAGVIFIGPNPDAIVKMGDKTRARQTMMDADVPVVPGTRDPIEDVQDALGVAREIGYPIMLKAAAGGGGKGMRLVEAESAFISSFEAAAREAVNAFGDGRVYMEKFVRKPRHVEMQVFGDTHGNVVHLFERECSIQRRHQKVIEESPSPFISDSTRQAMAAAAVQAAKAVNYVGAGTCEFLVDDEQNFYFLEMNTRLQVEHPVTELVTGVDLVEWQIRVARGEPLPMQQDQLQQTGWAMEARIYAEDPWNNSMPSPGPLLVFDVPADSPTIRFDLGVYEGYNIPLEYDPMIGKLVAYGNTRDEAIATLQEAVEQCRILGIQCNLAFHRGLLANDRFRAGDFDTGFLGQVDVMDGIELSDENKKVNLIAASILATLQLESLAHKKGPGLTAWQMATMPGVRG